MRTIVSWSGGKDSTATIILAHEMGIQIDDILFSEVMYDKIRGISGELPEFMEWMHNTAIPKIESWGYKVNVLHAEKDYLDIFFKRLTKGKYKGCMYGYALSGRCWINDRIKIKPIKNYIKSITEPYTHFIGIAIDEPERLARLTGNKRSLLAEQNMTEADARNLCEKYGLLAPTYATEKRGGCWFCPNSPVPNYVELCLKYPDLYNEFIGLGGVNLTATKKFSYNMTIFDLDRKVKEYIQKQQQQMTIQF